MIYDFLCKNLWTGEIFTLTYKDQAKANLFINRCKHSRKIAIMKITTRVDLDNWL